jgi:hypothetical protein
VCATQKERYIALNLSITMDLNRVPVCHLKTKIYSFEFEQYSGLELCAIGPPENKDMQFKCELYNILELCAQYVPPKKKEIYFLIGALQWN